MDNVEDESLDVEQNASKESETFIKENQKQSLYSFDLLMETDDLSQTVLLECINGLSEDDLCKKLKVISDINAILSKENGLYECAREEIIQQAVETPFAANENTSLDKILLLSFPHKCYYGRNRLKHLQKSHKHQKSSNESQLKEIQFKLENLSQSLKDLKISKENFNKNVRIGGQHPVTKRVILQKVAKFFDDSIKNKMAMNNRYKIQIQSNTMECNKLLSQIKEQEKRLASLDTVKYQEAKFEYEKSCKSLIKHRDQLAKCKSKFSALNQTILETKKNLEKEKLRVKQMKAAVLKKEYLKKVMLSERSRNDEKVKDLNAAMRKIQLDPRRHNLPEVSEYAKVKRENEILKQNLLKWKKKVEWIEQAQRLHLSARKRTQFR